MQIPDWTVECVYCKRPMHKSAEWCPHCGESKFEAPIPYSRIDLEFSFDS